MKLADCVVLTNREVMPGAWLLRLAAPGIAGSARPGQLVLLRAGRGSLPALRAALSVHRAGRGELSLLYRPEDDAALALACCRPGESVLGQGPLGRGFVVAPASRHLLLVAQDLGVAPLVALAEAATAAGLAVTLLAGAVAASALLPAAFLPAEVEYRVATSDGSLGCHGSVLDLLTPPGEPPLLLWADQVFAVGPPWLYQELVRAIDGVRIRPEADFAQGMLQGQLGCGLGACLGCAVETRRGTIYLCKQGPVVNLRDILF